MRILEVKLLAANRRFIRWEDCHDSIFDTIASLAHTEISLEDFTTLFNECSEEEKKALLSENTICEHQNIVFFIAKY